MTLQQFLQILLARRWVALGTLLATVAVTVVVSLLLPPTYRAETAVVIDVKSPDPIAGMVLPALAMPGYMATQVDIINSDRVARKVVRTLGMDKNPTVIEDWREATEGKGNIEAWLAELLQKKLDVKPSRESNVISIAFKAGDPAFAAAVANAVANAYIDTNIELKADPARQYAGWFEIRSKELRTNLDKAQKRLVDYQQQHGILAGDERIDSETQRLNELQGQLVLAQSQSAEVTGKRNSAGRDSLPDVMQSSIVQALKADVARADARLQDLSSKLGANHPQLQATQSEFIALKRKLAEEISRVSDSVNTAGRISKSKEAEIRANIEIVRQRILALKQNRGEIHTLEQEVENAQKAYDAVALRVSQSSLESQTQQTNVSVLSPAEEPVKPHSPKLLLNTLLAVFLGTLLGVGAALAMELADRRIRSREDLKQTLGLPILAELKAP
jgi:polysaccharide biosynthesis transport protein